MCRKSSQLISFILLLVGLAGVTDAAIIGLQAESGMLGAKFDPPIVDPGALGGMYITVETTGAGEAPNHEDRVATYVVTFPEADTYDLYARLYIQSLPESARDNDSMFYGNGFGIKDVGADADWVKVNGLGPLDSGYPEDEWFWINLSEDNGMYAGGGENPVSFAVLAEDLTQTLQIGAREDGLQIDAFVFATSTETFTDEQLDAAVPKTTKAFGPVPADDSAYPATSLVLSWQPGAYAADIDGHKIYFDPCEAKVQARSDCDVNGVSCTEPNYPVSGLIPGTVYYWAVDEVNGLDIWPGDVWSFEVQSLTAYDPDPYDGEISVGVNDILAWSPGISAVSHKVYLDKVKANVDARSGCHVDGVSTAEPDYYPGPLDFDTTYYWAIDEVSGPPDNTTYTGEAWNFTTMPDIQISDPNLVGWWTFDEGAGSTALDWSGHGNHGAIQGDPAWVAGYNDYGNALYFDGLGDYVNCGSAAIFDITEQITIAAWVRLDKFEQEWQSIVAKGEDAWRIVMNKRADQILFVCGGVAELAGTTNINDGQWHHVLGMYDGSTIYVYVDGAVDASQAATGPIDTNDLNVLIGETERPGEGPRQWNGLIDDVRIYNRALTPQEIKLIMRIDPLLAWNPNPANGSTPDVEHLVSLSWSPGENAAQHDVYFGTDAEAVDGADASDTTGIYRCRQDANTYTPDEEFQWGQTYYWRIDEYNTDETITIGRVWSITVADFLLVDDFEDYNDTPPFTVWNAWRDGFGDSTNGSQVGHDEPGPYAEQNIVNSGNQSMPLYYDNIVGLSEATRSLSSGRDWTREGVKALSLWFRGYPPVVGSFTEGPAGTYTMTAAGADIWGTYDEFHFAYKMLSGVGSIEAQVLSIDNTDLWAKAGVMIRETLEPGSQFAAVYITPGNGCRFHARLDADIDAVSDTEVATDEQIAITAPYWVRLERDISGDFTAYYSGDGTNWQLMVWSPQNIQMDATIYIGLAVTSHNADATCEAQFSNVTFSQNVSGDWEHQDIGILSNDAEPMYVAVANNTGTPAVVYHEDPNAAQIDDWTEWPIDLKDFEDQGIDLADVNSITIGFGNPQNPQAGGEGIMYFDDIRLYQPGCFPSRITLEADLSNDCVVDFEDLQMMAADWLAGETEVAADINSDTSVDLKDYAVLADEWLDEQIWPQP